MPFIGFAWLVKINIIVNVQVRYYRYLMERNKHHPGEENELI